MVHVEMFPKLSVSGFSDTSHFSEVLKARSLARHNTIEVQFSQQLQHPCRRFFSFFESCVSAFYLVVLEQGKTSHFCSNLSLLVRGWTVTEVPNGWYEVLRGPRPPSVRWPVVPRGQPSRRQSQPRPQSRPLSKNLLAYQTQKSNPVLRPSSMGSSPDVATEAARARVTAFEAAISALGSADEAALKSLHEAIQKAKQFAHVPPVGERLDACHQFIKRAKKQPTRIC